MPVPARKAGCASACLTSAGCGIECPYPGHALASRLAVRRPDEEERRRGDGERRRRREGERGGEEEEKRRRRRRRRGEGEERRRERQEGRRERQETSVCTSSPAPAAPPARLAPKKVTSFMALDTSFSSSSVSGGSSTCQPLSDAQPRCRATRHASVQEQVGPAASLGKLTLCVCRSHLLAITPGRRSTPRRQLGAGGGGREGEKGRREGKERGERERRKREEKARGGGPGQKPGASAAPGGERARGRQCATWRRPS